uniref:Uncharacterized protein n=1 Tax=Medicago truncatula TaxID=3880 RepID=Q1RU45_MEDTR|nr:hypothetical protein MtrDRAFT_AC153125g31v2 [Medicago truncatula]
MVLVMKEKCNEFLKLLNDFMTIRIGTCGTTKLDDLYKQFTNFKLRFNSFTLKESQFTNGETLDKNLTLKNTKKSVPELID